MEAPNWRPMTAAKSIAAREQTDKSTGTRIRLMVA